MKTLLPRRDLPTNANRSGFSLLSGFEAVNTVIIGRARLTLPRRKKRFDRSRDVSSVLWRMRLSKQHKIYAAVLGLAVSALAADQLMTAPADAEAAEVAVAITPAPRSAQAVSTTTAPAATQAAPVADTETLAARLQEVAAAAAVDTQAVSDAFMPSQQWAKTDNPVEQAPEIALAKTFLRQHRLTAVMKSGDGGVAVIDGKPFKPGQTVDGFRLVAVGERSAVLRRGVAKIELKLKQSETLVATSK